MTIRIINVHMQTTSFDRMRSKAAQARGEQDEEQERGIYLGYSDNFRENTVRRAGQAEQISSLINATEYPLIVCGDFNDPPGTFTYETLKNGLKRISNRWRRVRSHLSGVSPFTTDRLLVPFHLIGRYKI